MDAWTTLQELTIQDNKEATAVATIIMATYHTDGERATELDTMLRTRNDFPEALAKLLRRDNCTGKGAAVTRPTPDATEDAQGENAEPSSESPSEKRSAPDTTDAPPGRTPTISQQAVVQTRPAGQKRAGDNIEELRKSPKRSRHRQPVVFLPRRQMPLVPCRVTAWRGTW